MTNNNGDSDSNNKQCDPGKNISCFFFGSEPNSAALSPSIDLSFYRSIYQFTYKLATLEE